jgi:hypothetical protein
LHAKSFFLLAALVGACSPARGEPVGVSQGGNDSWSKDASAPAKRPPLAGLPPDFRTKLHPVVRLAKSEHISGASAIVWTDDAGQATLARGSAPPENALFVEELLGPAQADGGTSTIAIYLLSIDKAVAAGSSERVLTARFGSADGAGLPTLDDEGNGTSLCARCHGEAPRAPVWITR